MEKERKTKQGNPAQKQEQEQEFVVEDDEKVEKFFAIIRRLREARGFPTNSLREMEAHRNMKKVKKVQVPVRTPSFQLEDFGVLELADVTRPSSSNKEQEKEEKQDLDLNLSL